ncbi:aldo/keto reductase [Thalassomonas sp. RHCl1]|uniref:aldo/keto reductase n=1 Tax=Thalassomonas sp. RHCl1 TaxID=2995320 RepID=UPI00248AEB94|nr:aldo/keto reductase [Thalassomonas sp. RHCl1]
MTKMTGLGTFPFTSAFSPVDFDKAARILDAYFEAGGRYIDVAPTYGFGSIESFLGEYLADKPRESFIVSTSCGYVRDGDSFKVSGKYEDVMKDLEESLDRLKLDYLDIYISHIPDLNTPFGETASALQKVMENGSAKKIGVSNVTDEQLIEYAEHADIKVVQNRLSYINRSVSQRMQTTLDEIGAEFVAYQVIERGLLTTRGPRLKADNDLRHRKPEFEKSAIEEIRSFVVNELKGLVEPYGMSTEEIVVRWALSQSYVGIAQMGATEVEDAIKIAKWSEPLPSKLLNEVDELYKIANENLQLNEKSGFRQVMGLDTYDVRSGSASGK